MKKYKGSELAYTSVCTEMIDICYSFFPVCNTHEWNFISVNRASIRTNKIYDYYIKWIGIETLLTSKNKNIKVKYFK